MLVSPFMARDSFPRVASFKTARSVAEHLAALGFPLPYDEEILAAPSSPLAQPLEIPWLGKHRRAGNRFAVQPMEGWDGEMDGRPSDLTRRRWVRFGAGGAKLIWGCEAVAVLPDGRANPNQLLLNTHTASSIEKLRKELVNAHRQCYGNTTGPIVGLQLTHSGRFSKPHEKNRAEPVIAYLHPVLDAKFGLPQRHQPVSDADISRIVRAFGEAARLAQEIGFDFVDLKHCHGYLAHEFLGAFERYGSYGGSFDNRTRFLRELVAVARDRAPNIEIGVRLSVYDTIPYARDSETGRGYPAARPDRGPYRWGFGIDQNDPVRADLTEAKAVVRWLASAGVRLLNVTASSPYYAPHLSRPALFPPCDGYSPPEDPLAGAARLIMAAHEIKSAVPEMTVISTGWTYLQNYLPHFAQAAVRAGWTDFVGLGRMMLVYPDLPANVLQKGRLDSKRLCRTFSDCTNGPRNGLVSGCYPLDPFYKERPEATELKLMKQNKLAGQQAEEEAQVSSEREHQTN